MPDKIYAVKKGRNPGIYKTWPECKRETEGFPGAVFKSFKTTEMDKIKEYLEDKTSNTEPDALPENTAIAYVDGSYDKEEQRYGCGVCFMYKDQYTEISEQDNDEELVPLWNVAGEILGAMKAINLAIKLKAEQINIYYDYEGIEKWATDEWKASKLGTMTYKEFICDAKTKIKIKFFKVQAHAGVKYNERADELARAALGFETTTINSTPITLNQNVINFKKEHPTMFDSLNSLVKITKDNEFELTEKILDEFEYLQNHEDVLYDILEYLFQKYKKA